MLEGREPVRNTARRAAELRRDFRRARERAHGTRKKPSRGVALFTAPSTGENGHIFRNSPEIMWNHLALAVYGVLLCLELMRRTLCTAYGTKNCVNLIRDPQQVWRLSREIARNIGIDIVAIGGVENHIHFLMTLPPARAMANIVRNLKANSSHILRQENRAFRWQDGYAAISVSPSSVSAVTRYTEHQAEHHKACSFENEYIGMLERAGVEYDARYVWE